MCVRLTYYMIQILIHSMVILSIKYLVTTWVILPDTVQGLGLKWACLPRPRSPPCTSPPAGCGLPRSSDLGPRRLCYVCTHPSLYNCLPDNGRLLR